MASLLAIEPVFASFRPQSCVAEFRGVYNTSFLAIYFFPRNYTGSTYTANTTFRVTQKALGQCSSYNMTIVAQSLFNLNKTKIQLITQSGIFDFESSGITDVFVLLSKQGEFILIGGISFVYIIPGTNGTEWIEYKFERLSIILCQSSLCRVEPVDGWDIAVINGMWSVCGTSDFDCVSGASMRSCEWWDLLCHLMNFLDWLREQILNLLPQPIKDFFNFLGQLFAFLGDLLIRLVGTLPYFMMTIAILVSLGLVYYVVEYGVAGVGMYFEMLYALFRKFIDVIIKIIDTIIPF